MRVLRDAAARFSGLGRALGREKDAILRTIYLHVACPVLEEEPSDREYADVNRVFFIPGMAELEYTAHDLEAYLALHGRKVESITVNFFGDLQKIAERLAIQLDATSRRTGRKNDLIGRSLGGLVAVLLAQEHPELVEKVIGLGAPYQGTPVAHIGKGIRSCAQMTPGSPFLERMTQTHLPDSVQFYSIAGDKDLIVPYGRTHLHNGTPANVTHIELRDFGHVGLLTEETFPLINDLLEGTFSEEKYKNLVKRVWI